MRWRRSRRCERFVGLEDMAGGGVGVGEDGNGGDAQRAARAHDAASDLAAVGDQRFAY